MSVIDYKNPIPQFTKPLELGGGTVPAFHPNIDVRAGTGIDIVFDFNTLDDTNHIPVEDGAHDFVFCKFAIEHLSWRKVNFFIKEIHRVLAADGIAEIITANTFEQCKTIVERGQWIENDANMLFGGQGADEGYAAGSHKCGWSLEYLCNLFKSAGFDRVYGNPLPNCKTDLVLIAEKGNARMTKSI